MMIYIYIYIYSIYSINLRGLVYHRHPSEVKKMAISFTSARVLNPNRTIGLIWIGTQYTVALSKRNQTTFEKVPDEQALRAILMRQMSEETHDATLTAPRNILDALKEPRPTELRVSAPHTGRIGGGLLGKQVGISYGGECLVGVVIADNAGDIVPQLRAVVVAFRCGDIRLIPAGTFERNEYIALDETGKCVRRETLPPTPAAAAATTIVRGEKPKTPREGDAAPSSEEPDECPVCYELFGTKRQVQCVECVACGKATCRRCVSKHLSLSKAEAKCMHCDARFSRAFLLRTMGRSFVAGQYRKIRKSYLFDQEKARMPDAMGLVPAFKASHSTRAKMKRLRRMYKDTMRQYTDSTGVSTDYLDIDTRLRNINSEMFRMRNLLHNSTGIIRRACNPRQSANNNSGAQRTFRHACPNTNCRGFLSTAWVCPVCECRTCRHCLEVVVVAAAGDAVEDEGGGASKDASDDVCPENTHVCRKEALQSAQMIRKETKNCPSCASRIFKIDGCDQMWCTQCRVAFSWKTGRKVRGRVHNPHYFEWRRTT